MKIESSPLVFHPSCKFETLPLTPLQVQYLIFLRMNKSIFELIQYNLANGWLVSFKELYAMIQSLAVHNWIQNPEIKDYFQNIKLKENQKIEKFNEAANLQNKINTEELITLPFFRSLDPSLATFLLQSSKRYHLHSNMFICKTDDESRSLFVLLSGKAGIYKTTNHVKNLIAVLNPSSVFGEAGFLLGEKRTADAVTLSESDLLVIPFNSEALAPHLNREKATQLQYRFWVQHALLHSEMFKNFPSDCLDALTFAGKIVELKKDMILFQQNDPSETAYIVIQGELEVTKDNQQIAKLYQGAFLGEMSLMANKGTRTATVKGFKDTLLLEIHRDEFYKLLSNNLYLGKEIEKLVQDRLAADANRSK